MAEPKELSKSLGVFQLLAFGVAGVIGASWIYTNSALFTEYGSGGVVFGLLLGVLLAAFVAFAYAELTSAFPRAGGEVVFSFITMGRSSSFFTGWLLIGAYVSSLAFYFTAIGYLMGRFFPIFQEFPLYEINGEPVTAPVLILGVVLTIVYLLPNWFGVSVGGQIQMVMFLAIIIIGLALAVVGFSQGSPENFFPAYHADSNPWLDTFRFVIPGMTFLAGFSLVAVLAEDSKLKPRNTGMMVVFTVIGAGVFYALVLAATAWIIPWEDVAGMDLGTVSAFDAAGFPILSYGAYAIAVLGLLTSWLGLFIASSRILVAMGRAEMLPPSLAKLHPKHGTPTNALIFTAVVTAALGWLGPGAVVWFLDTGGVYLGVVWIMVVLAKYLLPRRYPNMHRPYRSKLGPLPALGALASLGVILLALIPGTGSNLVWPAEYIMLAAWMVLGIILFIVQLRRRKSHDDALRSLVGNETYTELSQQTQDDVASGKHAADEVRD